MTTGEGTATKPTASSGSQPGALRAVHYVGYGAGDFANNLAFSMASMFLLIYYTDVVGIPAAAAGTLFLIVRIWDGVGDLLAGRIVDRTSSRWGKYRPYLLFASLPLLLLTVALFSVPQGLGVGGVLVYAFVTYVLFTFAYGLVNIPYGSLASAMTQNSDERSKLSSARVVGTSLAILALAVAIAPQVEAADDLQQSLIVTTLLLVLIGMPLYIFTFRTSRERVHRDAETTTLRQTIDTLKHNRPLLLLGVSSVLALFGMFSLQTIAIYYARDVLGNAGFYIILIVLQTVGMIPAAMLVPRVVRAIGKKYAYLVSGVITALGGIGINLAPANIPVIAMICFAIVGVGLGGVNTLIWALAADTVEYGEWKAGVRTEGAIYSVLSLTRKIGQAIGAAAAAYIISLGGYVADAAVQSDQAITSIRLAAGFVPAAFALLAVAVMLPYQLTEARFREIVADIANRRAGNGDLR